MSIDRDAFDRLLGELRPKLHRYWARMTGSVIDGEDVLQDALIKAIEAVEKTVANPEAWLFRIAHNAALDHLRHRARQEARHADEDPDMIVDPVTPAEDRLPPPGEPRTLPPLPGRVGDRAGVVLRGVLVCARDEGGGATGASSGRDTPALHRARTRLRELSQE